MRLAIRQYTRSRQECKYLYRRRAERNETVRPEDLLRGSFERTIPASDPPPGTDEPTWTLRVRASVRGGLPVSDDYPLRPVAAERGEEGDGACRVHRTGRGIGVERRDALWGFAFHVGRF